MVVGTLYSRFGTSNTVTRSLAFLFYFVQSRFSMAIVRILSPALPLQMDWLIWLLVFQMALFSSTVSWTNICSPIPTTLLTYQNQESFTNQKENQLQGSVSENQRVRTIPKQSTYTSSLSLRIMCTLTRQLDGEAGVHLSWWTK